MSFYSHVILCLRQSASLGARSTTLNLSNYSDNEIVTVLNQLTSKSFTIGFGYAPNSLIIGWSQRQHGHLVASELHTQEWLHCVYTVDITPAYTFRETGLVI